MFIFFRDYSTWGFIASGVLPILLYYFIFFLRVGKAESVFLPAGGRLFVPLREHRGLLACEDKEQARNSAMLLADSHLSYETGC
jgi:hypothetical protein